MKIIIQLFCTALLFSSCTKIHEEVINEKASVQADAELPENPLEMTPLTFSVDPTTSQISTLYGNSSVASRLDKETNFRYPKGTILYQVTWSEKEDSWWYGARIPKTIVEVERLSYVGDSLPNYEIYRGKPLKKIEKRENMDQRVQFILSQDRLKMP